MIQNQINGLQWVMDLLDRKNIQWKQLISYRKGMCVIALEVFVYSWEKWQITQ